jgi:hypothetical protein
MELATGDGTFGEARRVGGQVRSAGDDERDKGEDEYKEWAGAAHGGSE